MRRKLYAYLLAVACLFASGTLLAQIKPETIRQIQSLLTEKAARSPAQQKMTSQLLQGVREFRGQKMVADVNLEPAKVNADQTGILQVDITATVTNQLLNSIRLLGGEIIFSSVPYNSIRAKINLTKVEAIAALPEVRFIQPAVQASTNGSGAPKTAKGILKSPIAEKTANNPIGRFTHRPTVAERTRRVKEAIDKYLKEQNQYNPSVLQAGTINSQGDPSHRANDTRNRFGYAGQGIKIGVLSDSYNALGGAPADVQADDLPGTGNPYGNTTAVTVVADYASGADEGRAMLQIVHDIAPKAQLFFASAFISEANFASSIVALRNTYNCDIIIDDVSYYDEPAFQDGIVAQAVNTVTAAGAMYFSSAGNSGSVALGTAGVWEGDFNDAGSPVFTGSSKAGTIHNFGSTPANGDSILAVASGVYNLQWSDAWGASSNDYDLFLVNSAGTVKASSTTTQSGTQNPYESFSPPTLVAGDRLIVFKATSAAVRAIHLNSNRGRLKVATTGQTHGHNCAVDAYCVAATPATGVPFVSTNTVESFSSDGLRRIFYTPNGTPITSGNYLFSTNGGTVLNKPDVTAADGVSTTLPSGSLNPFYGTSAAAPHAGAIAALLKSASPSSTPAQLRSILTSTALDIQTTGYDNVSGYGVLQAYQAMQSLNPTPLPYINIGTFTVTEGSFSNGNGSLDPGEIGNLVIQLNNASLVDAANVVATITTTTSGVTITQGTANYGTITSSASASNTGTPFTFAVNSSVACGTVITFQVKVTFSGGVGTIGNPISTTLGLKSLANIAGTLGATPPAGTGYTATSGTQTGRLVRGTVASTCAAPVANPGLTATTGDRQYDAYVFTNTTSASQCYTATLTSSNGANIYTVAYNSSGFVPSNPSTNYLAEPGQSATTQTYSFTVAAGAAFTVVVHDVNVTPASGSPYTLSVTYVSCAAPPACNPITITPATIPNGAIGTAYSQTFSASGGSGSGSFTYAISGNVPAGLTISGNTLSGTPTQAGTFTLNVTATDATGCSASQSYTFTIAGNAPASITTTSGTPQTTGPLSAFALPLKATVYDASNAPLSGVNVTFTAPTSGASGTFTGGVTTVTVVTDANGVATAPTFTANATTGSYTVTASVNGVSTTANFSLTNACATTFTVTSNADSGPGTLRDIVGNGCSGYTINFDPSITQITLTSGEIAINKALTITGPGANALTISGNNTSRVFNITAGVTTTVNISGITMTNGYVAASSTYGGGGIIINTGIVNVANCSVTNCSALQAANSDGGGLYNRSTNSGLVTIDRSSIINNSTDRLGGGIAQWGTGRMTITNSTIANNLATGTATGYGWGGGLFFNTLTTLTNCTVYNNSGYGNGGNIFRNASTLTVGNTIMGGGILTNSATTAANGKDVYGSSISSTGYNLIQNVGGYTLTGTTTGNQLGVNPKLFSLANRGGNTPTCLPMSNSPVINAGDPSLASGTDQRGGARVVGGQAEIGALETNYASTANSGTPQNTGINSQFSLPLQVRVTESGAVLAGDTVVYTAPATGASGTFPGASLTAYAVTDASGLATSPAFTANGTAGTYNVAASIGSAFTANNFSLTNNTVLPVVFGTVTAKAINCTVQVQWKTLTELNTKDFTVEYSTNGITYTNAAVLNAQGSSTIEHTYNYTHLTPAKGMGYYRIKQTDKDGKSMYSSVMTILNSCDKVQIIAYPNPVKDKLTLQVSGTTKQVAMIYDATGRLMTQLSVKDGNNNIDLKAWAKGTYTLIVQQEGTTIFITKVVKE